MQRAHHVFISVSRGLAEAQAYVLLGIIFFLLIVPIGWLRRLIRRLRVARGDVKGPDSYFVTRSDGRELVERMDRPF